MGLQKILTKKGSPLSRENGASIPTPIGATDQSKLQYTYSINGTPNVIGAPQPSTLDLNGQKPANSYDQTAPTEGIGNV